MTTDLEMCRYWESLVTNPAEASNPLEQGRVDVLFSHALQCCRCSELLSNARNTTEVYSALAESTSFVEEDSQRTRLLRLRDSNNQELAQAVREILLPSLPPYLRDYARFIGSNLQPNQLYLAGDAVSMMLHRIRRQTVSKPV